MSTTRRTLNQRTVEMGDPPRNRIVKLTAVTKYRICHALRLGAKPYLAARYGGIDEQTLYNWLAIGEADRRDHLDTAYARFFDDVQEAMSYAAMYWLEKMNKHSDASWQAAAWMLERTFPEDYGKQTKVKIEDWRSQIIEMIRDGLLSEQDVVDEVGSDIAQELFIEARVPSLTAGTAEKKG